MIDHKGLYRQNNKYFALFIATMEFLTKQSC